MEATFLGCGDAFAIPRPACDCPQCREAREDPRHARLRSGLLLGTATETALLDCSPDILRQLDRAQVAPDRIDRVVISHAHNDHGYGLYDLARLRAADAPPLRVHANPDTQEALQRAFHSLFRPEAPRVALDRWGDGVRLDLGDVTLEGFETNHHPAIATTAFLLEFVQGDVTRRVAYATDMGDDLGASRARIEGVDLFVGDGTYLGAGGVGHPGTDRVVALAREIGARRVAITHVGHWGVRAAEAAARLGPDVAICRDRDALAPRLG